MDSMSNQGASEFWAEVEILSMLRHCHLVSLIGYCNHETEMILVYEYMPHGTLEDHLHKLGSRLSWCQRLKVCIGAARGLDYLHTGTGIEFGIIHRDVKSSNILLDEIWAAKVSDFGLSKISPRNQPLTHVSTLVKVTFGYFDPNYFATGKLTIKCDVYSFGVVMLEALCRKRAVDDSLDWGIVTWAQDSIKEGCLKDIVDSDIRGEISPKCLKQFAQIAERCLNIHPKNRPNMADVVLSLEYVLALQEKSSNLLQTAGKTIFGRMADMFSFSDNGQKSDKTLFNTFKEVVGDEKLYMGNAATTNINGKGDVILKWTSGKELTLSNVLYVPALCKSLVSGWLLNKFGFCLVFENDKFVLSKHGIYFGKGYAQNRMFKLNITCTKEHE